MHRLRRLTGLLRVPWTDVVLAGVLLVAAVAWAIHAANGDASAVEVVPKNGPLIRPVPPDFPQVLIGRERPEPAILVNVVATLPVALRRRLPYLAFVASFGGVLLIQDGLTWPGFLAILVCAYSAVAYGRRLGVAFVLLGLGAVLAASEFSRSIPDMPGWLGPFVILVPVALAAATIRSTRARADAAARRAAALEQEQAATARAAIAEERARIARELHDVVSHHVSVMVIQAGAAGKVLEARPDLAAGALAAIETSGREAMAELRQLLGLLTPAEERLHPQPRLADLDTLVGMVQKAGQPVTVICSVSGLPAGLDLTAYRVVQEGLTNALRYAAGAPTTVELRREGTDLVVEVRNQPPAAPVTERLGAGRGLVGLAERVRSHHGTLSAERRVGGGYRLVARLPLAEEEAPGTTALPAPAEAP